MVSSGEEPAIIFLDHDASPDQDLNSAVGGKAANLMRMIKANVDVPVPQGFTISTFAFKAHCQQLQISKKLAPEIISVLLEEKPISKNLEHDIRDAVKKLTDADANTKWSVAVRSSATAEDLPAASFAGQQESFLNVTNFDELINAIRGCWASAFTRRAVEYRKEFLTGSKLPMVAVLVQLMVQADFAGVAFSMDPLGSGTVVVECVKGLGEDLVSGEKHPMRFFVKRGSEPEDFQILKRACLDEQFEIHDDVITGIAYQAVQLEKFFRFYTDIEWALDADKQIHLLQARAITSSLSPEPIRYLNQMTSDIGDDLRTEILEKELLKVKKTTNEWSLRPFNERIVMPMCTWEQSVLDFTIKPLLETLASFGIKVSPDIEPFTMLFERPYINVTALKHTFTEMPEAVEIILGSGHTDKTQFKPKLSSLTASLAVTLPRRVRSVLNDWKKVSSAFENEVHKFETVEISELNYNESLRFIDSCLGQLEAITLTHFQSVIMAEMLFNTLVEFLRWRGFEDTNAMATKLVGGGLSNATVRTNLELYKLAEKLTECPMLLEAVSNGQMEYEKLVADFSNSEPENRFLEDLENFLSEFGHRDPVHNFLFPSWKEDPATLLGLMAAIASSKREGDLVMDVEKGSTARKNAEKEVRANLERGTGRLVPGKAFVFKKLLKFARSYMTLRENQQFLIGRTFPLIRQGLLHIGELLSSTGVLGSPFEVFFLKHSELRRELDKYKNKVSGLVSKRMAGFRVFSELEPPDRINATDHERLRNMFISGQKTKEEHDKILPGVGVSPGIYTGPARLMHDPSELHKFKAGEILVCPTTNPAWTPVFPLAGAIVTDVGGMLSHGAVVAREYGIPAVLGTVNATTMIKDGEQLEVDGDAGRVRIVDIEPEVD